MKRNLMIAGLISLMLMGTVYAENASFSMSCTIPAIPGVNAPLIASDAQKAQEGPQQGSFGVVSPNNQSVQQQSTEVPSIQKESAPVQEQASELIQQEKKADTQSNEISGVIVVVKTFYSR
ncbi:MAG: hypothetical protein WC695_05085 [Candidatus Omnitrophota bacterium]